MAGCKKLYLFVLWLEILYYTLNDAQVVTDLQTSCNKVVVKLISGCVRTACSQLS
jgi:hypothetical protein